MQEKGIKMAQMTVEEYRKKHKRCRTCLYAYALSGLNVRCKAKNIVISDYGSLEYCGIRGMFCKLYQPKGVREDGK